MRLEDGIRRIKSHIISRNYIVEETVVSASKAAYLALLLKNNREDIERFDPGVPLPELVGVPLHIMLCEKQQQPHENVFWNSLKYGNIQVSHIQMPLQK